MSDDPRIRYAILCGSRTGSTHLCNLLESTNRLGTPAEYFNFDTIKSYVKKWGVIDHDDYYNKLYWQTKKDNDCIGVKIVHDYWKQMVLAKGYGFLDDVTHWIYLYREDVVLQAISRYKAWKSSIWVHSKKNKNTKVPYNEKKIADAVKEIQKDNAKAQAFLLDKPNVLSISYESDVVSAPDQTIMCILQFLGLPIEDLPELYSKQIVGNRQENVEWKQKYQKKGEPFVKKEN